MWHPTEPIVCGHPGLPAIMQQCILYLGASQWACDVTLSRESSNDCFWLVNTANDGRVALPVCSDIATPVATSRQILNRSNVLRRNCNWTESSCKVAHTGQLDGRVALQVVASLCLESGLSYGRPISSGSPFWYTPYLGASAVDFYTDFNVVIWQRHCLMVHHNQRCITIKNLISAPWEHNVKLEFHEQTGSRYDNAFSCRDVRPSLSEQKLELPWCSSASFDYWLNRAPCCSRPTSDRRLSIVCLSETT